MYTLFLVVGFVIYVSGGAEFFHSSSFYVDRAACDEFAMTWAEKKSNEDGVKEVYFECIPAPGNDA